MALQLWNSFFLSWKDGHLNILCIIMLCIRYWSSHFTCDIEYHNMVDFKKTFLLSKILNQNFKLKILSNGFFFWVFRYSYEGKTTIAMISMVLNGKT